MDWVFHALGDASGFALHAGGHSIRDISPRSPRCRSPAALSLRQSLKALLASPTICRRSI
jgi:hypothetical protein